MAQPMWGDYFETGRYRLTYIGGLNFYRQWYVKDDVYPDDVYDELGSGTNSTTACISASTDDSTIAYAYLIWTGMTTWSGANQRHTALDVD